MLQKSLMVSGNSDSVALMRFAAESGDDGASQSRPRSAVLLVRDIAAFARADNGGLIVTGSALAQLHRNLIIALAARHKLPAVYFERFFVTVGGLISYGPDLVDQYRRADGRGVAYSPIRGTAVTACILRTRQGMPA